MFIPKPTVDQCLSKFSAIFFTSTYQAMLLVGLGLGIAKGVRTVYMAMIVPNYVPIERLAYASGIQMVINGVIIMLLGPLLGKPIYNIYKYNKHK